MPWVNLRYLTTSTRGLSLLLLLSTSHCHASLHLCSPPAVPGSGMPSSPPGLLVFSSSSLSQRSEDTQSLSDVASFSSAEENAWAAPWPPVPLACRMEQDVGRKPKRESRSWSVCNWLQKSNRARTCYYMIHPVIDAQKRL